VTLFSSRIRDRCSKHKVFMFVVTAIMYALAACHWALDVQAMVQRVDDPTGQAITTSISDLLARSVVLTFCFGINVSQRSVSFYSAYRSQRILKYMLSDMIVLWRAHIFWGKSHFLVVISASLMLLTIGKSTLYNSRQSTLSS
jgi:hypothetical protein